MSKFWVGYLEMVTATMSRLGGDEVSIQVDWNRGGNFDGVIDGVPYGPAEIIALLGEYVVVTVDDSPDADFDCEVKTIQKFMDFLTGDGSSVPSFSWWFSTPMFVTDGEIVATGEVGVPGKELGVAITASHELHAEYGKIIRIDVSDASMWDELIGYTPTFHQGSDAKAAVEAEVKRFMAAVGEAVRVACGGP